MGTGTGSTVIGTPATIPSPPQELQATSTGNAWVFLTWTTPTDEGGASITGYMVYCGSSPTDEHQVENITSPGTLYFNCTGLENGVTYYFTIAAENAMGTGMNATASAMPSTVPGVPQDVSASMDLGYIDLSWTAPASNGGSPVTQYDIYRGTSSGSETFLATVAGVTTFTDKNVSYGQAYYYTVVAINNKGAGAQSSESSITPTVILTLSSFWNLYGTIILILGPILAALIIIFGIVAARKKAQKKKPVTKRKQLSTVSPAAGRMTAIEGKKPGSSTVKSAENDAKTITAKDLAELHRTEQEVTATIDVKICVVHKGPIKGANYSCPHCNTFYCLACASALAKNGENCWSCGQKFDLDEAFTTAGTKQLSPEKTTFYCNTCARYSEIANANFTTWENCPACGQPLIYVKRCSSCTQPIALSKELYAAYKGKPMQCPNCSKEEVL
jgi:hypothetical protein